MNSDFRIKKAVVPAAGLGTRHFPASHAVKKELFPVVGADGIARALFHYHLIEMIHAGIEEICLIVQPGDDAVFRSYLEGPDEAYLKRLEKYPKLYSEAQSMRELAKRICFVTQHTQDGFGHAVYQTKDFAAGEMILLCLGDHLFRGAEQSPYLELANSASAGNGCSVSAVNIIHSNDLKGFGTIAGTRRVNDPRLIDISLIIEKPDIQTAQRLLRVDGLNDDEFLGWFGMHVLAPSIYTILEEMIDGNLRDNGEFQLTRAQ
jgi:UTP--glucose-1-phosphate uridylyltransferase